MGTARVFFDREPIIVGRVAVATGRQRGGIGTEMMRAIGSAIGDRPAELHAQAHLEAWYHRLGWRTRGERYMEAGIPHVTMTWPAP